VQIEISQQEGIIPSCIALQVSKADRGQCETQYKQHQGVRTRSDGEREDIHQ
jgi:hypothetical protein